MFNKNKRGDAYGTIGSVLLILLVIGMVLSFVAVVGVSSIEGTSWEWVSSVGSGFGKYVFGMNDAGALEVAQGGFMDEVGGFITFIMVWLIIFVSFGDIFSGFTSFSKTISWIIAFAVAIIAANTGLISKVFIWITGVFVWAGVAAVYLGLGSAFIAFLALHLGLGKWVSWAKTRQEGIQAMTGSHKAGQALEGLKAVQTAMKKSTPKAP
jgi:hypothetical protein